MIGLARRRVARFQCFDANQDAQVRSDVGSAFFYFHRAESVPLDYWISGESGGKIK